MCGIAGIIYKDSFVNEADIQKMLDVIVHRGPDGQGTFIEKNIAFGHRRLSIIDLSDNSSQPMHYNEKYVLVFNGEIYNYIEIREELISAGYAFKTTGDTEVLIAAYDKWGSDCVKKFNGMWAFALYDKQKQIVFISRDRFGVKPLYYAEVDNKFVLCSEIKQLLHFYKKNKVNHAILLDYLLSGLEDHTDYTFFEGVFKLPQSHNMTYNLANNTFRIEQYYTLLVNRTLSDLNETETVDKFKSILLDSVKLRLRSDVCVGTCLSGGTDSSAIASMASSINKSVSTNKFIAITAKSVEQQTDESAYAEMVVKNSNLDWRITEPTFDDFKDNIEKLIYNQEEPFGSPSVFMQAEVFRKAKEAGCIVMLDGQGGDEILLGYERYYAAYIKSLPFFQKISESYKSVNSSRLSAKELIAYLYYFTNFKIRISRLKKRYSFVKPEVFESWKKDNIKKSIDSYKNIIEMQKLELMSQQLPHLLRYEDKNSMMHSIESRLPFLDYRVVETALSINNKLKIKNGWSKYILRKSIENIVPKEIAWRKNKLGFNAPEKLWIKDFEKIMIAEIGKSKILKELCSIDNMLAKFSGFDLRTKWKLYNIAKWEELYNVEL